MRYSKLHKAVLLLGMGGSTLALGGGSCASNAFYQRFFSDAGNAAIGLGADNVLTGVGTDFDAVVATPLTALVQAMWSQWVDLQFADDFPANNPGAVK